MQTHTLLLRLTRNITINAVMQGLYFYFVPFVFLLMCMPIQIVIITPLWEISVAGFAF
jgi:small-conductance mechanosensitive channel